MLAFRIKPGMSLEEIVKSGSASVASLDAVRAVFETNVSAVIAVTQAMLPLLREAPTTRIVNVSSCSGSLALNSKTTTAHCSMFGIYSWSKTALDAIMIAFAFDLESDGIKVNAAQTKGEIERTVSRGKLSPYRSWQPPALWRVPSDRAGTQLRSGKADEAASWARRNTG